MSKTIEEAAERYANEIREGLSFHACEPNEVASFVEEAYSDGANHVLSLPLSERLTDAEKATLLMIYAEWKRIDMDDSPFLPAKKIDEASAKIELLESIFGKEMFEKED